MSVFNGDIVKNEPVLIQSLVQAILGLFLAFGVNVSNEQVGAIMAITAVILAILARIFVTPNNKLHQIGVETPVEPEPEPPVAPTV